MTTDRQQPPVDLIAYNWAESLSQGEQDVLLISSLRRLQGMIDAARVQPVDEARVERLARETWEAICAEATRGGDKTSVEIISSALVAFRNAAYTSERRCGKCGHNGPIGKNARCWAGRERRDGDDDDRTQVHCGCKCVFPATGALTNEQRDKYARMVFDNCYCESETHKESCSLYVTATSAGAEERREVGK